MFDSQKSILKTRLREGTPIGLFWFSLGSAALVEAAISGGADAVVLDLQHGLFERRDVEAVIGRVPPSIPCLVRIEDDSAAAISRALDAGAEGILAPMIESGEQARAFAAACHFPPKGTRSGGGVRPLLDFGAYRAGAADAIAVGVMIETATGVAAASAIAADKNVDFVFIGSGDLALSLGTTPADPEPLEQAFRSVLAACQQAGKPCGIFTFNAAEARRRREQGFSLTVLANDTSVAVQGFGQARSEFQGGA